MYSCEDVRFTQLHDKYIIHDYVKRTHLLRFPAAINSCNSPRAVLLGCVQAHLRFMGLQVRAHMLKESLVSCQAISAISCQAILMWAVYVCGAGMREGGRARECVCE